MKKIPIITLAVEMAVFYAVSRLLLVGLLGHTHDETNTMLICLVIASQLADCIQGEEEEEG